MSESDISSFLGETQKNTDLAEAIEQIFTPQTSRMSDPFVEADLMRENEVLKSAYKDLSEKYSTLSSQNDAEIIQLQTQFQDEVNEFRENSRKKDLNDIFSTGSKINFDTSTANDTNASINSHLYKQNKLLLDAEADKDPLLRAFHEDKKTLGDSPIELRRLLNKVIRYEAHGNRTKKCAFFISAEDEDLYKELLGHGGSNRTLLLIYGDNYKEFINDLSVKVKSMSTLTANQAIKANTTIVNFNTFEDCKRGILAINKSYAKNSAAFGKHSEQTLVSAFIALIGWAPLVDELASPDIKHSLMTMTFPELKLFIIEQGDAIIKFQELQSGKYSRLASHVSAKKANEKTKDNADKGISSKRTCRNFSTTGQCRYGDTCIFLHENPSDKKAQGDSTKTVVILCPLCPVKKGIKQHLAIECPVKVCQAPECKDGCKAQSPMNCYRNRMRRSAKAKPIAAVAEIAEVEVVDTTTTDMKIRLAELEAIVAAMAEVRILENSVANLENTSVDLTANTSSTTSSYIGALNSVTCSNCGDVNCQSTIIDSGANALFINEQCKSIGTITSSNEILPQIAMAEGDSSPMDARILVGNTSGFLVKNFTNSLLPPSVYGDNYYTCIINGMMHIIEITDTTSAIVAELLENASPNSISVQPSNGLYHISCEQVKLLCNSDARYTSNTSYFTVKLDTNEQRCDFWREVLGVQNKRQFVNMVKHHTYDNLPAFLTVKFINKYYDDCNEQHIISTIRQKPVPPASFTKFIVGEKISGDVMYWPDKYAKEYGFKYTVIFVDACSGMTFSKNTNALDDLETIVMNIVFRVKKQHKNNLRILQLDKSFMTSSLKEQVRQADVSYEHVTSIGLATRNEDILLYQPSPNEHEQNGQVESVIKSLRQIVIAMIESSKVNSPIMQQEHLAEKLFPYAVTHATKLRNDQPTSSNPTKSRREVWNGYRPNALIQPALVFGTRVIAHTPLSIQRSEGKLSPRGYAAIFVGYPPGVHMKGCILLLREDNLKAPPSIRRTFVVKGKQPRMPSTWRDGIDILLEEESLSVIYVYDPIRNEVQTIRHKDPNTLELMPLPVIIEAVDMQNSDVNSVDSTIPFVKPTTDSDGFPIISSTILPSMLHIQKSPPLLNHSYIPVFITDTQDRYHHFWDKIGMQFVDFETQEHFKITNIVKYNKNSGPNSKTILYQLLDVTKYPFGASKPEHYEYMSCTECLRSHDTVWDDVTNRTLLAESNTSVQYISANIAEILTVFPQFISIMDESSINLPLANRVSLSMSKDMYALEQVFMGMRTSVDDIPPPRNFPQCTKHPESFGHLKSLDIELEGLRKTGQLECPENMNIRDIPPSAILQFLPIWQKKYVGMDFEKFKCRMIILGNHWRNIFNEETYSGMTGMDTMKMVLAIAATRQMSMSHIDLMHAFLTTKVNKVRPKRTAEDPDQPNQDYFLRRPPGMTSAHMPYIVKPQGFVYGHPLAARALRLDIHDMLIDLGFKQTIYDSTVYVNTRDGDFAILCVAVDDMPLFTTSSKIKSYIIANIESQYEITIKDPLETILGLELKHIKDNKILLRQRGHLINVLKKQVPNWEAIPIISLPTTPLRTNADLPTNQMLELRLQNLSLQEINEYEQLLGDIQWMLHTEPACTFATRELSKLKKTKCDRWELDRLLLHFVWLLRTEQDGIILGGLDPIKLLATVDSSYHGNRNGQSQCGATFHLGENTGAFAIMSKTAKIEADSAMAIEGVGGHFGIRRVIPYRYFLDELGCSQDKPTNFYMDNKPFIQTIVGARGNSPLSKHILIRLQLLKQAYDGAEINLLKLSTENMVADIMTKALGPKDYIRLRSVLHGHSPIVLDLLVNKPVVANARLVAHMVSLRQNTFEEIILDKDYISVIPKLRLRGGGDTPKESIPLIDLTTSPQEVANNNNQVREHQHIPISRWICLHCQNTNSYDDDSCCICNFQPRQDRSVWQCCARDCNEMNHYQDTICQSCGITDPNADEYYTAPIHITLPMHSTSAPIATITHGTTILPNVANNTSAWTFSDWFCANCQEGNKYQDDSCYNCHYQMRNNTAVWMCISEECDHMNQHQDHICMLCGTRDPSLSLMIHPPISGTILGIPVSNVTLLPVDIPVIQGRLSLRRQREIDRYSDESEQRRQRIATQDIVHPSARASMRRATEYIFPRYLPHIEVPGFERFYTRPSSAVGANDTDLRLGTFTNETIEPSSDPILYWHGHIGDINYADALRHAGHGAYLMVLRHPYKTPDGKNLYVNSAKHVAKNLCKASTVNCNIGAYYKATGSPITPNCKLKYINGHPVLYVIRTIFAGEELFWDYGRDSRSIRYYPWDEHQVIPLLYNWQEQFPPT